MHTYERILQRLGLKARTPYRKDLNEDFPLRGFILCADCQQPLTGAFSTSRSKKKHPYYRCKNGTCRCYGKGLRREQVEGDFTDILSKMAPSEPVIKLLEAITKDCWQKKRREHGRRLTDLERAKADAEQTVAQITARLVKTSDEKLVEIYENQVKEHESRRRILAAQAAEVDEVDTSYEKALGTVLDFVGNPKAIWQNGSLDDKRLVLKLAFAKPVTYDKETGLGTAVKSLPFTVFQGWDGQKGKMVVEVGFEPTNS